MENSIAPKPLFETGQILGTPGVIDAFRRNNEEFSVYLERHTSGDYGTIEEEDKKENEISIKKGFRILSSYTLKDGAKFWIITEADRTVTTFLLPDEY